jgi:hypothetical protein
MRANEGDQVLAASGSTALILQVLGADGSPPYVVRWDGTGHISMIVPDQYSQVVPRDRPRSGGQAWTGHPAADSSW